VSSIRTHSRLLAAIFALSFTAGLAWLVAAKAWRSTAPPPAVTRIDLPPGPVAATPMDALASVFVQTELRDPRSRRNYELFLKAHPASPQKALGDLTIAGLKRLDDRMIARRGQIALHLLELADESTCAGFMGDRPIALAPLLERLPEDQRRDWVGISVRATFLELNGAAYPTVSHEEMAAIYPKIFASADPQEKGFLSAFFNRPAGASLTDHDHCQAIKALYSGASRLPARERAIALKTFAGSYE
jgi:hypothetical protein